MAHDVSYVLSWQSLVLCLGVACGTELCDSGSGEVCTVDASVACPACAVCAWKPGHYFFEPLVHGWHLLVFALPEEYRKFWFYWETAFRKCLHSRAMLGWTANTNFASVFHFEEAHTFPL